MEVEISRNETEPQSKEGDSLEAFDELKLKEFISEGKLLDFDGWIKLISEVEGLFRDEIERVSLVYDAFLSEFPLCYGYWRRYADHVIRLCTIDKAVEVFERAVQSATYSVDVWDDYCGFAISAFEDANDIRRLFKRAMSFVGKDYLCHTLWDKYIGFEFSQQQWSSLAKVCIQTLKFPSKKLHHYYESFQKFADTWKGEIQCLNNMDLQSDPTVEKEVSRSYSDDEISYIIRDMVDPSTALDDTKAVEKYLAIGNQFYREASQLAEKIDHFESSIRRPYFHVKSLDITQLENWHEYLNFVEMHGDFDWAVKLYERCLIPCANYPEFWMRYVDFMESKGGRELANFALARATQTFLKRMPVIHLFSARFKEKIRDASGAHVALLQYETESDLSFVETVSIKANMERRLGNFTAASNTYKEALEVAAAKEKFDILPILYINFSRLQYMINNDSDAARDILIGGTKRLPRCKLLLEELIKFGMMHEGPRHIQVLDAIVNDVICLGPSQGMNAKEAEDISSLYLQFVDLCGTIDDIRKAWNRHVKCFLDSTRMSTSVINGIKPIPLETKAGRKQESPVALPSHSSGEGKLDIPTQSPSQDKILRPPENDNTQPNHAALVCASEKKSPLQENHGIPLDQATVNRLQAVEVDENLQGGMQHGPQDVSEQLREDIKTNTNLSSHDLTNEVEALQSLEENHKEKVHTQEEHDHKSEQDANQLSLERLSLGHLDLKSLDSISLAHQEGETSEETSLSNRSVVKIEPSQEISMSNRSVAEDGQSSGGDHFESSPMGAQASDSAGIQTEMARSSSPASPLNNKKTEPLLQRTPTYSGGGGWHQRSNANRLYGENKFGYRRHSHKRLHQRRQVSPQRQYSLSETGTQVPMTQGYPSQSMSSQSPQVQQGGQTQSQQVHTWSMQNAQQQSFAPSQTQLFPLPAYPQPQISQHPMQSNEQFGQMQNSQAYNHMWQYYFYQQQQQQQFLLQQQQQQSQYQQPQAQQQPPQYQQPQTPQQLLQYQQPQAQQQYQEPQAQQQYQEPQAQQQQPQHQQPHAQQQLLQQQYQQHRQLLMQQQYLQQQQLLQQQLPYQQTQLLQLQQQHQEQQYQQQQQLQQQGSYQQQFPPQNDHVYLQQQQQQQQQQQEQEQRQQEQQITASQVQQTRNDLSKEECTTGSRLQKTSQGQDTLSYRDDASETVLSASSLNSQQRSSPSQ